METLNTLFSDCVLKKSHSSSFLQLVYNVSWLLIFFSDIDIELRLQYLYMKEN